MEKVKRLKEILRRLRKVLIAYSGGVDSTFLLKISVDTLGKENVIAVTARSETYPLREYEFAKRFCSLLGVRHIVIKTSELKIKGFRKNPPERCYFCKKELFSKLKEIAKKYSIKYVLDGSNYSDTSDYRPGFKAKKEMGIKSPLIEARLTKKEIREFSKRLNLPTKDKGSFACLASRFPYGEEITKEKLKMIDKAEDYIYKLGFKEFRVRYHNLDGKSLARVEINKNEFSKLNPEVFERIFKYFKRIGFDFVTLDLEGYKRGKMNRFLRVFNPKSGSHS